MFTLIYPSENIPRLPLQTALCGEESGRREMFPVVRENGEVIAYASREYCHSGAKPLHPVVHLHLIDRTSRLYLQKRSMSKDIQPGRWDTAVGGHVDFGEDIYEALLREAREELGMTDYNPVYLQSYIFESEIEKGPVYLTKNGYGSSVIVSTAFLTRTRSMREDGGLSRILKKIWERRSLLLTLSRSSSESAIH